jgi:shikimate dehydrogenase
VTIPLRFGLVGQPVRHSLSPALFGGAFAEAGLPHGYSLFEAQGESGFEGVLAELREGRLAGLNVTAPFKQLAAARADDRTAVAEDVGAANVLVRRLDGRVLADNTDVGAVAAEIAALRPAPRRVAVLGAGGAALAVARACRDLGASLVAVTTRSWGDSEALVASATAERLRAVGALPCPWPVVVADDDATSRSSLVLRLRFRELAATADVVVQATSAGVEGGDPGTSIAACIPWDELAPGTAALDLVYRPRVTPFLLEATSRRLPSANGLGMLIRQAEASYAAWLGGEPPVGAMRRAAERVLGASARRG